MPYKAVGNRVWHKVGGRWRVKQRCRNAAAAKRAVRLLYMKTKGR